jgi:hypothetical protein
MFKIQILKITWGDRILDCFAEALARVPGLAKLYSPVHLATKTNWPSCATGAPL